jgi:hypothetical protein
VRFCVAFCASALAVFAQTPSHATRITWEDLAPLHAALESRGLTGPSFDAYFEHVRQDDARRVREGDLDHLIFYALQSTHFTSRAPIEPALSAKAFHDARDNVPGEVSSRLRDLLKALDSRSADPRLVYFRNLLTSAFHDTSDREAALVAEYRRVMGFVYNKEFVAQRAGPDAVAELYRARGLSTDTAVEAGYIVYNGLGVLKSLDPGKQIRRVLIVGPGLDLAPRTSLLEAGPPESYQPWAVIDALVSLGLSRLTDLTVVGADINPRVVDHLRRSQSAPPSLTLVSGIAETPTVQFSQDYRDYFARLGRSIGDTQSAPNGLPGHLSKTVRVRAEAARTLDAEPLDIVTARLDMPAFDLIIATNILPYFDDTKLALAMTNIAGMLAPGGVLLHNEARPVLGELCDALGLPYQQSRQGIIASVRGAPALSDTVWLHRKR